MTVMNEAVKSGGGTKLHRSLSSSRKTGAFASTSSRFSPRSWLSCFGGRLIRC